jgi:four helix bundle protein
MAKTLEELPLYSKVTEFCAAVTAILKRSELRRDRYLWGQIDDANDSIDANMQEGFEQPTDAAFAQYVFVAKGSTAEVLTRLRRAQLKGHITVEDLEPIDRLGESIGKMMGGFIKYLHASGFTDRGRHAVAPRPPKPAPLRRIGRRR